MEPGDGGDCMIGVQQVPAPCAASRISRFNIARNQKKSLAEYKNECATVRSLPSQTVQGLNIPATTEGHMLGLSSCVVRERSSAPAEFGKALGT